MAALSSVVFNISDFSPHATTPATKTTVYNTNGPKHLLAFSGTLVNKATITFLMPPNYIAGTARLRIKWFIPQASAAVFWRLNHRFSPHGNGAVANVVTSALSTAHATSGRLNETVITIAGGGIAVDTIGMLTLERFATDASDTGDGIIAYITSVTLEYSCNPTIIRRYYWIGANAFTIPTAGTAALINSIALGTDNYPYLLQFNDAAGVKAYARIKLPDTYGGSPKTSLAIWNVAGGANAAKYSINAGSHAVGANVDPALTPQTSFSITPGANNTFGIDLARTLIISPTAGDTLVMELTRDNSDAMTVVNYVIGMLIEHAMLNLDPAETALDPQTSVIPATNGAAKSQVDDTDSSRWIGTFGNGVVQGLCWQKYVPFIRASGGTAYIYWSSTAASGSGSWRIEYASPATDEDPDPAVTVSASVATATNGANELNETAIPISTNVAALDIQNITLIFEGDVSTLGADATMINGVIKFAPSI